MTALDNVLCSICLEMTVKRLNVVKADVVSSVFVINETYFVLRSLIFLHTTMLPNKTEQV